jgi:hypothetical protein
MKTSVGRQRGSHLKWRKSVITVKAQTVEIFRAVLFGSMSKKRGTRIVYHIGHLAYDRYYSSAGRSRKQIDELAGEALKSFNERRTHLVQRRLANNIFEYMAVIR